MPRIQLKGDGRKARAPKETLGRLLSYMAPYKWTLALVLVCILVTSVATVAGSKSLQYVVDDYIRPLLQMDAPWTWDPCSGSCASWPPCMWQAFSPLSYTTI